jgi:copper(I)-binding protein
MKITGTAGANVKLWASAAVFVMCGSLALAQGTLPLPTPGTSPAAPAATPGDTAAKARAAALAAKANVDVSEAWTRATTNATSAPIYLHIISAKDADRLVGVEAAMAKSVELREDTPQAAGRAAAAAVIDIPAGATVALGPGGRYLMLVGIKQPLKEGDSFLLTLHFDKAGTENAAVKILGTGATGMPAAASARRGDTTASVTQH